MKAKKINLVIDHPIQIIPALGVGIFFRKKNYHIHLLVSRHQYWQGMEIKFLEKYFDKITFFPKINFSWILPREIIKIIFNNLKLNNLGVKSQDTFFIFSDHTFLESLILKKFPKNKKICLLAEHLKPFYAETKYQDNQDFILNPISEVWQYLIFPLFKLEPQKYYWGKHDKKIYRLPYVRPLKKLFDKIYYLVEPEIADFATNLFPRLDTYVARNFLNKKKYENSIFFFGDSQTSPDQYQTEFVNKCLRYIEKKYPNYKYYFKPHPKDIYEYKHVNLGKFRLFNEKITTELLLLKYKSKNNLYFGLASLSLKSCYNFGERQVYSFLDLYDGWTKEFKQVFIKQYGHFYKQRKHFIRNFNN